MVTPTAATLDDGLREFLAAGSGLAINKVVPGNDGGPVPEGLFASVMLVHQAIEGIPATAMSLADDKSNLDAPTMATVHSRYSAQWFRQGAQDAARRLTVWVWSPEGLAKAQEAGLTVRRVSDVRRLDEVVSGAWEERAGVDIDVGYVQTIDQTVDYLKGVPIAIGMGRHTEDISVEA